MSEWVIVQEDRGGVRESWCLLAYLRDGTDFPPIVHMRIRGWLLAKNVADQLNERGIGPEGFDEQVRVRKCPNPGCDRPYDQEESRVCTSDECGGKYKSTCANDHCLECGAST